MTQELLSEQGFALFINSSPLTITEDHLQSCIESRLFANDGGFSGHENGKVPRQFYPEENEFARWNYVGYLTINADSFIVKDLHALGLQGESANSSFIKTSKYCDSQFPHRDHSCMEAKLTSEFLMCFRGLSFSNKLAVYPYSRFNEQLEKSDWKSDAVLSPLLLQFPAGITLVTRSDLAHSGWRGNGKSEELRFFCEFHLSPKWSHLKTEATAVTDRIQDPEKRLYHTSNKLYEPASRAPIHLSHLANTMLSLETKQDEKADDIWISAWNLTNKKGIVKRSFSFDLELPAQLQSTGERLLYDLQMGIGFPSFYSSIIKFEVFQPRYGLRRVKVAFAHFLRDWNTSSIAYEDAEKVFTNMFGDASLATEILDLQKVINIPVGQFLFKQPSDQRNQFVLRDLSNALKIQVQGTLTKFATMTDLATAMPNTKICLTQIKDQNVFGYLQTKMKDFPSAFLFETKDFLYYALSLTNNQFVLHVHRNNQVVHHSLPTLPLLMEYIDFLQISKAHNCYTFQNLDLCL